MGTQYSIDFKNNSTMNNSICVYQKYPIYDKNVYSLAWFAKKMAVGAQSVFKWGIDYTLLYSETGEISPGVHFATSLSYVAEPDNREKNGVNLLYEDGTYDFEYTKNKVSLGSIGIKVAGNVPNDAVSIGVGMGGKSVFATNAKTNMNFVFTPHPSYYITFGDFKEGYVIDANQYTDAQEIKFQENFYTAVVTLENNNKFKVTYK